MLSPTVSYGFLTALYVAGSMIVGVGMAKVIEVPALALRERIIPRAGPPASRTIEGTTST